MMRDGVDAAVAGGLLVLADGEEVAAEHRAVQHDAHDKRDEQKGDQAVRHAVEAAGGQPFERREARAEGKAGGGVVGVVARDAAIDQQAAQRHHERLQPDLGDQQAMHQTDQAAERDDEQRRPGPN